MKINFISNLPLSEISGGFSGLNAAVHEALSEIADIHYVGPINPPPRLAAKALSKLARSVGGRGDFFFFSEERLGRVAAMVQARRRPDADFDFYHGFTPWIACNKAAPYLASSDCSFADYVDIYHPPRTFRHSDIARICEQEAAWMKGAQSLLLTSEWAAGRVNNAYNLPEGLAHSVGIFGAMEIPATDRYQGGHDFLFISTNYAQKNGPFCRRAMELVWARFPQARLKIIGAAPPQSDLVDRRITYEGYFSKSDKGDLLKFSRLLESGFALLHPTLADITPHTVVEAAFHGCPVISGNAFGIPEITGGGQFAILLDRPYSVEAMADSMCRLLSDPDRYLAMRAAARAYAVPRFSRHAFKARLQQAVSIAVASLISAGR